MGSFTEADVRSVVEISGCTEAHAREALKKTTSLESAVNWVFNNPPPSANVGSGDDDVARAIQASIESAAKGKFALYSINLIKSAYNH